MTQLSQIPIFQMFDFTDSFFVSVSLQCVIHMIYKMIDCLQYKFDVEQLLP
jgi:hypothetical protein